MGVIFSRQQESMDVSDVFSDQFSYLWHTHFQVIFCDCSNESLKYQERSNLTVFGASVANMQDNSTTIPITVFANQSQIQSGPGPYLVSSKPPLVFQRNTRQWCLNIPISFPHTTAHLADFSPC
jgi:hypothetical protein